MNNTIQTPDTLTEEARKLCRSIRRQIDQLTPLQETCHLTRQRIEYLQSLEVLAELRRDRRKFQAEGIEYGYCLRQHRAHRVWHPRHKRGKMPREAIRMPVMTKIIDNKPLYKEAAPKIVQLKLSF